MAEWMVWIICHQLWGAGSIPTLNFSIFFLLPHANSELARGTTYIETTLICIIFGNILLLQTMLMLRKAGPRMLSVIL